MHTIVLGSGPDVVHFSGTGANPEAWQKADDKAAVAELRAEGKVPLRPADYRIAHGPSPFTRSPPACSAPACPSGR